MEETGTLYQFAALRRSCLVTGALALSRRGIRDAARDPLADMRSTGIHPRKATDAGDKLP